MPTLELSDLAIDGGSLVIDGHSAADAAGWSVAAAGDVNGDGLADLILGAPEPLSLGERAGKSYVVFGTSSSGIVSLSSVALGVDGFIISGQHGNDQSGRLVAGAGDINGDGLDDLIVGVPFGDPAGASSAGRTFLVFGKSGSDAVDLEVIAGGGAGGFVLDGQSAGDYSGLSASAAGDVNGDGLADLIVGALGADPAAGSAAGRSYVVFGRTGIAAMDLAAVASGSGGFVINGTSAGEISGNSVSAAGDVNGDGLADLIVGAPGVGPASVGRSYVVFGKTGGAAVELSAIASGSGGFVIGGQSSGERSGRVVAAAGDVNGDGFADLLIGAPGSDPVSGSDAGRTYVVFGKSGGAQVSLAAIAGGSGGFVVNGEGVDDSSGYSIATAGDLNGDGLADLLVGAPYSDPAGRADAGRAYVVWGKTGSEAIDLSAIAAGIGGFALNGENAGDWSGTSVAGTGDFNGDGLGDLFLGAPGGDPHAAVDAGRGYVVFGRTNGVFAPGSVDQLGTSADETLVGTALAETIVAGAGNDTLIAGGGVDVLYGGSGDDSFIVNAANVAALAAGVTSGRLSRIDGGTGTDRLIVDGSGLTLDLRSVPNQGGGTPGSLSRLESIEWIDLTGTGNNVLRLVVRDVLDVTGTNLLNNASGWVDGTYDLAAGGAGGSDPERRHQLVVSGNDGDILVVVDGGGWINAGNVSYGSSAYEVLNNRVAAAQLLVRSAVRLWLVGAPDNDTLVGGPARDVLEGKAGNDTLDGGAGADSLTGGDGDDLYYVDTGGDQVSEGTADRVLGGNDTVATSLAAYTLAANVENLRLLASGVANGTGNELDNVLYAAAGNNVLDGGIGTDTVSYQYGVSGTSGVSASLTSGTASGGSGSDRFTAIENLTGSANADSLTGDGGANVLDGGAGNDTLNGAANVDTMIGGDGSDGYYVDHAADQVIESNADLASGGTDIVYSFLAAHTLSANVENGRILASGAASLTGNGINNVLYAGVGANNLTGGDGTDTVSYLYGVSGSAGVIASLATGNASGGSANDTFSGIENLTGSANADNLTGDGGANVLAGGSGNDTLDGGAGADTLDGGSGDDTAAYGSASGGVTVSLALAGPQTTGSAGSDVLMNIEHVIGGAFADNLTGNSSANRIAGGAANDTLDGGAGSDTLLGGDGDDLYYVDTGGDQVSEGTADRVLGGNDTVATSLAAYTLTANVENLRLLASGVANGTGNELDNVLYAAAGNNVLDGGIGTDTVSYQYGVSGASGISASLATGTASGGSGSDRFTAVENLTGSANADSLTGDGGSNVLDGGAGNDTLNGAANVDTMIGGDGSDSYYVDHAADQVLESNADLASGGTDIVYSFLAAHTLAANVENGRILASGAASLTGNAINNLLYAGVGANNLTGGDGTDTVSYLYGVSGSAGVIASLATGTASGGSASDTFSGIENLTGSANADNLTGDGGANVIDGGSGNDSINGGGNADTMAGGDGNDNYYVDHVADQVIETSANLGSGGTDIAYSFLAAYTLTANVENGRILATGVARLAGNELDNLLYAAAGDNVLNGGDGSDTVSWAYGVSASSGIHVSLLLTTAQSTGGSGSDTLLNIEHLVGSSLSDTLSGNSAANMLAGGGGDDTLDGGAGDDTLDGGAGIDTVSYASATGGASVRLAVAGPQATGSSGIDSLLNVEHLLGSAFADTLTGNGGANWLRGGNGNDTLDGAAGVDTLEGGDGDDLYYVDTTADLVFETNAVRVTGGEDTVVSSLSAYTLPTNVEILRLIGTEPRFGSGNDGNNILYASPGDNFFDGGLGSDTVSYALGVNGGVGVVVTLATSASQATRGSGSDSLSRIEHLSGSALADMLTGDSGSNRLAGDDGDDLLDGSSGDDTLDGGGGEDTASYASATSGVSVDLSLTAAQPTGGSGSDVLLNIEHLAGSDFRDVLKGDAGANRLDGAAENDSLIGGFGDDTVDGGAGNDTLDGGNGEDIASYQSAVAAVTVSLAVNTAQATGGAGSDTLLNLEHLVGTGFADRLTGNAGANRLVGAAGNDTLAGGTGDDTLDGGLGADSLSGGDGSDVYFVDDSADVVSEANASLSTGGSDMVNSLLAAYSLTANVENLRILAADTAEATGNALDNMLFSGSGNNVLDGGAGSDTVSYAYAIRGVSVSLAVVGAQATAGSGFDTLLEVEHLDGSAFADALVGNADRNRIGGGAGDDTIDGAEGADSLNGGDGNDRYDVDDAGDLVVETNADRVTGGDDTVWTTLTAYTLADNVENLRLLALVASSANGNDLNNIVHASGGNNELDGRDGSDTVSYLFAPSAVRINLDSSTAQATGGSGVDRLLNFENVAGSDFDDILAGDDGRNALYGNGGDDQLDGGSGNDTLDGGDGEDTASYATAATAISVNLALTSAQTTGGSGLDVLLRVEHVTGSASDDSLAGSASNNLLSGGAGSDTLDGAAGADTMIGGDGNDIYRVDDAGDVVTETGSDARTGGLDVVYSALSTYTLTSNVENLRLLASSAADGVGNSLDNTLFAGSGRNLLDGGTGNDTVSYVDAASGVSVNLSITGEQLTGGSGSDELLNIENLAGSDFDDLLRGDASRNEISGGAGADTLDGGSEADTLEGGDGSDLYYVDNLADVVRETNQPTAGEDTVWSTLAAYALPDNVENLRLLTTGSANATGNELNNVLYAGEGDNLLDGGAGSDTVSYAYGVMAGALGSSVSLAATDAQRTGGSGLDTLLNIEHLIGSDLADVLLGNSEDNALLGGEGDDVIGGSGGNDTLDGGRGSDALSGDEGNDLYYIDATGDSISENNADRSTGGDDTVCSGLADYTLPVNVENLRLLAPGETNGTGNGLDNILYAGIGSNILDGGAGGDTVSYAYGVVGASGVSISLARTTAQSTGGSGQDTLRNIENLAGSANADSLTGDGGANVLDGGGGNDTLNGGANADTMTGGDGNDSYYVDHTADQVVEANAGAANGGTDIVYSFLAAYSLTANVENGRILVSASASLTGNAIDNVLYAGVGANNLIGGDGTDTVSYLYGVSGSAGVVASLATGNASDGSASDTFSGIENLAGSANADILTGDGGANLLDGGAGNDSLDGGFGNDSLDGGSGSDTMSGGDGSDSYYVDHVADRVVEGNADPASGGTDTVHSFLAAYTLTANVENGRILASGSASLTGNASNNLLYAGVGANNLSGGDGSDTVSYLYGVAGSSGVTASLATGNASGGSASDTFSGIENLTGSANNDSLTGDGGANVLDGGAGNDTLNGAANVDTMIGGDGSDSYYVDHAADQVLESNADLASGGTDIVYSFLAAYSLTANVENGRILASGAASLTGNAINNVLYAGVGANNLTGGDGTDTVSYLYGVSGSAGVIASLATGNASGGSANDTFSGIENLTGSANADRLTGDGGGNVLDGDNGNDWLDGGSGNDSLDGGFGRDTMTGGDGNDSYYVDHTADQVVEANAGAANGGTDIVYSFLAAYSLTANVENGRILASASASLTGNASDNVLYAGVGANNLIGGDGTDTVSYLYGVSGSAGVVASLATGNASDGSASDTFSGIENLAGSANADSLTGDGGANFLDGGAGNDSLDGGFGNDSLDGGSGSDTMSGGDGSDSYYVDHVADRVVEGNADPASGGADTVHSFLAAYTLTANVENGRILASGSASLTGNASNNLLYAGVGANNLSGGDGSDTVSYLYGVAGSSGVTASLATGNASGGSASDTFSGIENLTGSANNDSLTGDGGANVLDGGAGNDTLNGAANVDTMIGGDGSDSYYVDHAADQVLESNADLASGGTDIVYSFLAAYSLTANVENGRILASGAASLTGNATNNVLYAGVGANNLSGGDGSDTVSYLYGVSGSAGVIASLATGNASGGSASDTFSGIENLAGSIYADTLTGDGRANRLDGANGNDTLNGGAGDDVLDGGLGADSLIGGDGSDSYYVDNAGDSVSETSSSATSGGTDQVFSALAAYTLTGNVENGRILAVGAASLSGNGLDNLLEAGTGNNTLDGGGGNDTVSYLYGASSGVSVSLAIAGAQTTGGSGSDTLIAIENLSGSSHDDTLTGDGNANRLSGAQGNDLLDGGFGNDTLDGGAGNDRLLGGAGADSMLGGDGSDLYSIDNAGDTVVETNADATSGGTDQIFSHLAAYTLTAHVENGRILATGAANLSGNGLDNVLEAATGNNAFDGAAGNDTVSYLYGASSGVSVSLALGGAQATGGSGSDTLIAIENLTGSNHDDTLAGSGDANRLNGAQGNDFLDGAAGNDTLDGGAGNDRLWGGTGADSLIGGDGSDLYYVDHAGDSVSETNANATSGGTDQVFSYLASYTLGANVENGRILAVGAANLSGNSLDNLLDAATGNNAFDGAGGNDTVSYLYGASGGVSVSLASTGPQATGGSGSDTLVAIENLTGSTYADTLTGDGNANRIEGGNGNDTLVGGAGNDRLVGGFGNDSLVGGAGADIVRFDILPNSVSNRDTVGDFDVLDDTIELENAVFNSLVATGSLAPSSFRAGAGFTSAADADDYLIYDSVTGALYYDAGGNSGAAAVHFATLVGAPVLTSLDFVVT
ncbi:MAG: hypothetical protein V5B60_20455 [Accumulibacter sp.]|jgi:Ca2+-binding RTX toxin-like protein|uniref:hypothetical protein n=1 Tax=Accumulibacter sp. TaxID=2053492 RepID=UPI002FC27897